MSNTQKQFFGMMTLVVGLMLVFAACNNGGGGSSGGGGTPNGMVWVAGGTFTMGSPAEEEDRGSDETEHSVTLGGFYIGKHAVTQGQYQAVMGYNPSAFTGSKSLPVENVTWYDAVEFCNKLSEKEGLEPAYTISDRFSPGGGHPITNATVTLDRSKSGYRLPTEAEWEYAARGGADWDSPYCAYAGGSAIDDVAWYWDNSDSKTHEAGGKAPNGLGLHDMSGNVFEWCWDWYDSGYYSASPSTNPLGAFTGRNRVFRGGSWLYNAASARSAFRTSLPPSYQDNYLGFRLVSAARSSGGTGNEPVVKEQDIWGDAYFADYRAGLTGEAASKLDTDTQYQYYAYLNTRILGTDFNASRDITGSISVQAIDVNPQDIVSYAKGTDYKAAYDGYKAAISAGKGSLAADLEEISGIIKDNDNYHDEWTRLYLYPLFKEEVSRYIPEVEYEEYSRQMQESLNDPYFKYYAYIYTRLTGGWFYNLFTSNLPSTSYREEYANQVVPTAININDLIIALSARGLTVSGLIDDSASGERSRFWVCATAFKYVRQVEVGD